VEEQLLQQEWEEQCEQEHAVRSMQWSAVHILVALFDRDSHVTSADEPLGQIALPLAKLRPILPGAERGKTVVDDEEEEDEDEDEEILFEAPVGAAALLQQGLVNKEEYEKLVAVEAHGRILTAEVEHFEDQLQGGGQAGRQGGVEKMCSACQRQQGLQAWGFDFDEPLVEHGRQAGSFKGSVRLELRRMSTGSGGAVHSTRYPAGSHSSQVAQDRERESVDEDDEESRDEEVAADCFSSGAIVREMALGAYKRKEINEEEYLAIVVADQTHRASLLDRIDKLDSSPSKHSPTHSSSQCSQQGEPVAPAGQDDPPIHPFDDSLYDNDI
jgi:hypothetical protein